MSNEFLYLLSEAGGLVFKIGVSIDPYRRGGELPQAIDFARSVRVPMTTGAAYGVERLLHYLFRDQQAPQPPGDGHTEWFHMVAWPAVLAFLAEQRERLGVGEPEPIPLAIIRHAAVTPDPAIIEARRLRAEAKEREFVRRQEERRELAIKHNGKTVAWLRTFLAELEAIRVIKGILVYNNLRIGPDGALSAALLLSGRSGDVMRLAEDALVPSMSRLMLRSPGIGMISIFGDGEWYTSGGRGLAALRVSPNLLTLPNEWTECVPFVGDVQQLLLPWVARKGSRRGPQLLRLLRLVDASQRQMFRDRANDSDGFWA